MTPCAYCGKAPGVTSDHVVPKSYHRRAELPKKLRGTVRACMTCNLLKGQRRLVPPSWAKRANELNQITGGTPWRVWNGSVISPAFAEVWK